MVKSGPPSLCLYLTLTGAIAITLILFCTSCGCISFIPDSDNGAYQPPTFEPTIHPTNIPTPSPTIVCEPSGNQTTAALPVPPVPSE